MITQFLGSINLNLYDVQACANLCNAHAEDEAFGLCEYFNIASAVSGNKVTTYVCNLVSSLPYLVPSVKRNLFIFFLSVCLCSSAQRPQNLPSSHQKGSSSPAPTNALIIWLMAVSRSRAQVPSASPRRLLTGLPRGLVLLMQASSTLVPMHGLERALPSSALPLELIASRERSLASTLSQPFPVISMSFRGSRQLLSAALPLRPLRITKSGGTAPRSWLSVLDSNNITTIISQLLPQGTTFCRSMVVPRLLGSSWMTSMCTLIIDALLTFSSRVYRRCLSVYPNLMYSKKSMESPICHRVFIVSKLNQADNDNLLT